MTGWIAAYLVAAGVWGTAGLAHVENSELAWALAFVFVGLALASFVKVRVRRRHGTMRA